MTDLQATLDAIEQVAVHECGHCRRPLRPDAPSPDFCSDDHQAAWLRAKQEVVALVGYREPWDLPQHFGNLVEMCSPETTPAQPDDGFCSMAMGATDLRVTFTVDTTRLNAALDNAVAAVDRLHARLADFGVAYFRVVDEEVTDEGVRLIHEVEWLQGPSAPWSSVDELHLWQPRGLDPLRAMSFGFREEEPHPEPCEPQELFGADFDFEHRPATTLPDEPPPAVLPPLPERDWQALVDARTRSGPDRARPSGRRQP